MTKYLGSLLNCINNKFFIISFSYVLSLIFFSFSCFLTPRMSPFFRFDSLFPKFNKFLDMAIPNPQIQMLETFRIVKSTCNRRFELNESQVSKMMTTLLSKQWLPAILVRVEGNHYGCYDGIHRLEAYKRCGFSQVPVIIKSISDLDATINSYRSNCGNNWTEADRATICLNLYIQGKSVEEFYLSEDIIDHPV